MVVALAGGGGVLFMSTKLSQSRIDLNGLLFGFTFVMGRGLGWLPGTTPC